MQSKKLYGGTMYCNGIATIRAKTKLALKETAGIMIWQLSGDAKGKQSLLGQINEEVNLFATFK